MVDRQLWIFEQFARKLAEVAESMLGSTVTSSLDPATPLPDDPTPANPVPANPVPANPVPANPGAGDILAWRQAFDIGEGCELLVAAPLAAWEKIGGETLKAAGVDERDTDSVRGTYLEILSQALSSVASEMGAVLSRNVSPVDGREIPYASAAYGQAIALVLNGEPVTLFAGVDPLLVAALKAADGTQKAAEDKAAEDKAAEDKAAEDKAGAAFSAPPMADGTSQDQQERSERQDLLDSSKTLDLLLDVELPVSVSFGRASVPLKDVLKLTSGSIVELNRGVTDPVELIVNNCVIARGEVVVVEGNYGVRIQQIISARERLRTLN